MHTLVVNPFTVSGDGDSASLYNTPFRSAARAWGSFEALLSDLSSSFLNVSPTRVDEAIATAAHRVGEELDIDRVLLFLHDSDGVFRTTHAVSPAESWAESLAPPIRAPLEAFLRGAPSRILRGEALSFATVDELPLLDRESVRQFGTKSLALFPLSVTGHVFGAMAYAVTREERRWSTDLLTRLRLVAEVFANLVARRRADEEISQTRAQLDRLRKRADESRGEAQRGVVAAGSASQIVGASAPLRHALEQVSQVAATSATVLLLGETGTGKELFASHVHELSPRRGRPMVRVNCSAIPAALIESELFGREKGAFTGALSRQLGRFEVADQSTLFLDEIGDLPLDVQIKLLRVLQERQIERLGSSKPIKVDVRIVAATNRDLEKAIAQGTFREDLFYRLNVFPIRVPALRERPDDIPMLVWGFIDEFSKALGKPVDSIAKESLLALQRHPWPGNVRELRNVVERSVIVARGRCLTIDVPRVSSGGTLGRASLAMADVEREHILAVLDRVRWRIRGVAGAADLLRLKPSTLESRMTKLGIHRTTS